MRKHAMLLAVCGAVWLCISPSASASLLAYEPFDYTAGQRVLGQANPSTGTTWRLAAQSSAGGDTSAINVAQGSLSVPAPLAAPVGNAATINGVGNLTGASNRLAFTPAPSTSISSGSVYYSFALRVDDVSGATNGFFTGLNNTGDSATTSNPSAVAARLQLRVDPGDAGKFNLGISRNRATTVGDIPWSGPMNVGETLFIVAAVDIVDGTQNDVARLWINPGNLGEVSAPGATLTDSTTGTGTDINIASLLLRQSPAPFLTIDEIRVGTTWADVTPEPGTLMLLVAAFPLLRARRRHA